MESYLERCVNSVLKQTYNNLEIILVNDGSTDISGDICDEFAKADKRVHVIHQSNKGLAEARNAGIEIAKGEYISFLDSDDWINELFVIKLYNLIKETNSEIAACNFIMTSKDDIVINDFDIKVYEFSNTEALEHLSGELYVQLVVAWGKLYHKRLFNKIRFPTGKIHEDEYVAHKILYEAEKIVFTNEQLLYYWQRRESIMGSGFKLKNSIDKLNAYKERVEFLNSIGMDQASDKTNYYIFYAYREIIENTDRENDLIDRRIMIDEFRDLKFRLRKGKHSIKFRLGYELYYLVPFIMKKVFTTYLMIQKFKHLKQY